MLQPYYGSTAEHERSRAVDATLLVLRVYLVEASDIVLGVSLLIHKTILKHRKPKTSDHFPLCWLDSLLVWPIHCVLFDKWLFGQSTSL